MSYYVFLHAHVITGRSKMEAGLRTAFLPLTDNGHHGTLSNTVTQARGVDGHEASMGQVRVAILAPLLLSCLILGNSLPCWSPAFWYVSQDCDSTTAWGPCKRILLSADLFFLEIRH